MSPCNPNHHPLPILTLRLSHPNFLDAVLTNDGEPVYSLETVGNQTTMLRCNTLTDGLEEVASVRWPEFEQRRKGNHKDSGVIVTLQDGLPQSENDFLKLHSGVMTASRKFHLPGQDRALRWRRNSGGLFECTSPITSIPIAHFEPSNLTSPAKLKVFVHDLHFQHNFRVTQTCGVNTTLLDYLILTSLLLVTHRDDWRSMPLTHAASGSSPDSSPISPTSPVTPFTSCPSPVGSQASNDSWYRSPQSATQTSSTHSFIPTSTPVVRPPSHRPRTSPASTSPSSIYSQTVSIRRVASTYVRPDELDSETSPVLDIRPSFPVTDVAPPSTDVRPSGRRVAPLRLHVPSSPLPPSFGRRSSLEVDPSIAHPFLKEDPADLPPPYEEIEWTVRVRGPRRVRSTVGQ